MTAAIFMLCIAALMVHEVDAMHRREWRLLFGLRDMVDERARPLFLWLHWPLFLLYLWPLATSTEDGLLAAAISAFAILHLVLHLRLKHSERYEFTGAASYVPIFGAAVFGALHLAMRDWG